MKLNKTTIMLLLAATAIMASCKSDDTDFSDLIDDPAEEINPDDYLPSFDFDTSSPTESTETILAGDNDYLENWNRQLTVAIAYSDSTATISGSMGDATITTDGAHVKVNLGKDNICFSLSGESADGSFKLYGKSRFMVELNGLTLGNPNGAAINSQCGKTMYLVLADGTDNTLSDGETYQATGSEDMKGCLFSEGQIIISGKGSLGISATGKNGIASDDYVMTRPGIKLNITATSANGIKANDGVFIRGGAINIASEADGYKGINSERGITVSGGRTIIHCSGSTRIEGNDTTSSAALKCDSTLTMTSGILYAKATGEGGKGVNTNLDARIMGGTLAIATYGAKLIANPHAIKADGNIEIAAASVVAYSSASSPLNATGSISYTGGYATLKENDNFFMIDY